MGRKILYKLVAVGDADTGKTSTTYRFTDNVFSDKYRKTIGADFLLKLVQVEDTQVSLQIWDTAGEDRFKSLGAAFYRGTDAFLLFYDVTNPKSLANIPRWLSEIKSHVKPEHCVFILVGNKSDLTEERRVDAGAVEAMREKIKNDCAQAELPLHMEISAKDDNNVKELFSTATKKLLIQVPPEAEEEADQPKFVSFHVKPKNETRKNAAIIAATILIVTAFILAVVFWPVIVALTALELVLLTVAAIAVVAAGTFGAYKAAGCCKNACSRTTTDSSTLAAFKDLGIEELGDYSESENELDDQYRGPSSVSASTRDYEPAQASCFKFR